MKHLRWLPPGEWPQVPVDPEDPEAGERDATRQELLQMDLVPVAEHPDGGWIVDCLGREGRTYPGVEIARGRQGGRHGDGRFRDLGEPSKRRAYRAVVYRDPDGLRSRINTEDGPGGGPARTSPRGRGRLREIEHRGRDDDATLARARELAADPETAVRRMRVPLDDVGSEDVVEVEAEPGHRWAGE